MNESKAAKAFQRKLLIAWCIANYPSNLTGLQKITGMPRRTLQDCIKGLEDIGLACEFIQQQSARNNQGEYRITSWGPISSKWVNAQIEDLSRSLDVKLELSD